MTNKIITANDIPNLADNIRIMYSFLHPKGLEESVLEKKADEHTFYKIILYKYKNQTEVAEWVQAAERVQAAE